MISNDERLARRRMLFAQAIGVAEDALDAAIEKHAAVLHAHEGHALRLYLGIPDRTWRTQLEVIEACKLNQGFSALLSRGSAKLQRAIESPASELADLEQTTSDFFSDQRAIRCDVPEQKAAQIRNHLKNWRHFDSVKLNKDPTKATMRQFLACATRKNIGLSPVALLFFERMLADAGFSLKKDA